VSSPGGHGRTEGERWSERELQALLADRFAPRAIGRFLLRSQRRAADVRRARPELARQARRWTAAGAAAWLVPAAAGREPFRRRAAAGLAWWAVCAVMLDWHLGMVEEEDGRPASLAAADGCTLARAWLVPVAADAAHPAAVALAAATDLLDGRLARASRTTRAGRDLEGLVDLCFAVAALRGARRAGGVSRAAVAAEATRLGAGLGFSLWTYFGRAAPPSPALVRAARLTTPVRVAGLLAAGAGRRREADALVLTGAAASVGLVARAVLAGLR
jgi:phosphatidylglycerophosphate synthase